MLLFNKVVRIFSFTVLTFISCYLCAQDLPHDRRKGFLFGTSAGAAYSILKYPNQNLRQKGFALDLSLGYKVKFNLAILLTSNITIYDYIGFGRNRKRDFGVLAPSVQYWLNQKFWVLGGLGLGGDNPVFWDIKNVDADPLETKYYHGLGLIAAVGYEVLQFDKCTINLKAKITYRNLDVQEGRTRGTSFSLLTGVNF